ncbi:hypothetical protein [Sphingopyxis panaciterrulae]|uniref:Uncharacterized protein n=1 Tax=Sphingopyxis panaciterrulae TaxID=462372 RepID=A0A7W9B8T5_9SPHN|nr:hypothetical protein [Sphingopyxis panaciterrulae]MBB5708171.1 hypothetical protein [Sphingopyxis panaciterrulae]
MKTLPLLIAAALLTAAPLPAHAQVETPPAVPAAPARAVLLW